MSGSTSIGWFGKLPSHGDFLKRRVSESFDRVWDAWLQECIAASRARLGEDWLSAYLTSPVWRFYLGDGVAGSSTFAGILLPSVDRVGRYFPLTVFAELPADLAPMAVAIHGRTWMHEVENIALDALEDEDLSVDDFDSALLSTSNQLASIEQYAAFDAGDGFPEADRHWRIPVASVDRIPASLIDPLMRQLGRRLRPLTMWWTDGSERVGASCLLSQKLPHAERFTAMLNGAWAETGWKGAASNDHLASQPSEPTGQPVAFVIRSSAVSEIGSVRKTNQDRVLDRPDAGLWAVADGMGGHAHGELASQMIVDVLGSVTPAATVNAAVETASAGLAEANQELRRAVAALSPGHEGGSTVVLLCIRQNQWAVLWAGDSRAYLFRDGTLGALTQDHASGVEDGEFDPLSPPMSTGAITRAVGGADELILDHAGGTVDTGDRFVLCSDGVHGSVPHDEIANAIKNAPSPEAAVAALIALAIAQGSADNISAVVVDIHAMNQAE